MQCIHSTKSNDANLTEEELRDIIREGGNWLNELIRRMQRYNSIIIGSALYFYLRRLELESLCEKEELPTVWFTLSTA